MAIFGFLLGAVRSAALSNNPSSKPDENYALTSGPARRDSRRMPPGPGPIAALPRARLDRKFGHCRLPGLIMNTGLI
jgi:hypothetical protein